MAAKERYELDHSGNVVVHESALCERQNEMIQELFSQFSWQCDILESKGSRVVLKIKEPNAEKSRILTVYRGTIRNEDRNAYEKKMQLGASVDPRTEDKENALILGIYVFNEGDSLKDAIFVGLPIRENIDYPTNPSLRGGLFVDRLLKQAKTKGFVIDRENRLVGFRPEFIQFYLDNHYSIHYTNASPSYERDPNPAVETVETRIINEPWNLIYFGAPGTGKSYKINELAFGNKENGRQPLFSPKNVRRVTFHPEYTYAQFVGCFKPFSRPVLAEDTPAAAIKDAPTAIEYAFVPGPFLETYTQAINKPEEQFLLIIEEINRANPAAVFGDLFQLLDRSDNGVSEYPIDTPVEMRDYLKKEIGQFVRDGRDKETGEVLFREELIGEAVRTLSLPSNMYIWASMNSADQGVFPIDSAFRRRWEYRYVSVNEKSAINSIGDYVIPVGKTGKLVNWNNLRCAINNALLARNINEDKLLGPFFIKPALLATNNFNEAFKSKVLFYLREDVMKMRSGKLFSGDSKDLTYSRLCERYDESGLDIFDEEVFEAPGFVELPSDNEPEI